MEASHSEVIGVALTRLMAVLMQSRIETRSWTSTEGNGVETHKEDMG